MARVRVRVRIDRNAVDGLVHDPAVQADMDRRAQNVLNMQKRLVPVDTGDLRNSLEIRETPEGGRQIGTFGDVEYAAAVEEGHETKSGTWVPPQPYIAPSLDAARE